MQSCDTFALSKTFSTLHANTLAKNSDRPLGEAQPFSFYPGGAHEKGAMLRCTHLTIPQAARTYTVLGSRPYWIWGFEMGLNERGLMIGNEAEFSRCEAETEEGLLGMDLLRLALERAATAREGITVITQLLEAYGQNANANPLFDRRYENSFLLVDPQEIWLLETAGRQWAAKHVDSWAAISNCYSIGADYDLCSENLESLARENRWLRPDEPFVFSKAYGRADKQSTSLTRWRRLQRLIALGGGPLSHVQIQRILRDHFEDTLIAPRFGAAMGSFQSICMHAAAWNMSQTAASMIAHFDDALGPIAYYAPSLPCCSCYIPVYWTGDVPAAMKDATGTYDENALWWAAERLSMLISVDEERFAASANTILNVLRNTIPELAAKQEEKARALIAAGQKAQAMQLLQQFTQQQTDALMQTLRALANQISEAIRRAGGLYGPRKEVLGNYAQRVHMPL